MCDLSRSFTWWFQILYYIFSIFFFSLTFNPIVKPTTIRLVLNIVVNCDWSLHQLDVNNAFLQSHLSKDVFVAQPLIFIDPDHPDHACKLWKAIYGLKQAPWAWYHEFHQFLINSSFTNSHVNTSLFVLNIGGIMVYLLIYVDDIIITCHNDCVLQKFILTLAQWFSLKDLNNPIR